MKIHYLIPELYLSTDRRLADGNLWRVQKRYLPKTSCFAREDIREARSHFIEVAEKAFNKTEAKLNKITGLKK